MANVKIRDFGRAFSPNAPAHWDNTHAHFASRMKQTARSFGLDPEETKVRIAKAAEGLRLCSICKEYRPGNNFIANRCNACVSLRAAEHERVRAKAEARRKERKERKAEKSQFVIGLPLLPLRNNNKIKWYGPVSSYMEVYNFLAKVYPDPDSVPKEIKIDFRHTLKGPFYTLKELHIELVRRGLERERAEAARLAKRRQRPQ